MKTYYTIILIFLYSLSSFSQDNIEIDSNSYPWYSPSLNYLQFYSKNSLSSFYDALQNSKKNKVSIIHFGDSHIQSEIPTNETKVQLQKKYGNGGRGLVFPYSTAKTYSSIHYSTKHLGNWNYSKSTKPNKDFPLGIMGMSSKTTDSTAGFTITFNTKVPTNNTLIRIFCENDSLSYDLIVETDGKSSTIDVHSNSTEHKDGFIYFTLPSVSNTITFKCLKSNNNQKQFIIHGFELLNTENKGVIYYTSGVGGAKFNTLLAIDNLNSELKAISPDLVILDFGTNDFLYSDSIKATLEFEIKNIISNIRKSSPLVSIVLCTTQDLYYKQKNLTATEKFATLIKQIAKESETAYWDWFAISGGRGSLKSWLNQGLAKNDMIHLTNNGYRIKGKLFFEAIENTKKFYQPSSDQNQLIINSSPKKLEEIKIESNQITTLSNRETSQEGIVKKDSLIDFQNQILSQDSIKIVQNTENTITTIKDTLKTNASSIETDIQKQSDSLSLKYNTLESNPIQNTTLKTDSIQTKETTINDTISNKLNVNTNLNHNKNTADILRPNSTIQTPKTDTIELHKQIKNIEITKVNTTIKNSSDLKKENHQSKNIKVELFEDINDSTLAVLEKSKDNLSKKNVKPTKKNYEIARERQHQIIDHDTLALNIPKDSIAKPIIKQKSTPKQPIKPKNLTYKVKSGDNLSYIAEKFNVKVSDIKTWNKMNNDNLSIGQTIIIKR